MAGPRTLSYEDLVEAYNQRLGSVLRGFDSGVVGLESWVPTSEPLSSVAGLLDATRAAGEAGLTVLMTPENYAIHSSDQWAQLGARHGAFSVSSDGSCARLVFSFQATEPRSSVAPQGGGSAGAAVSKRRTADGAAGLPPEPERLPAAYRANVIEAARTCAWEGYLEDTAGAAVMTHVQATDANWRLEALVGADHVVLHARHHGAAAEDERGVLELLCRAARHKPILEWADHGALVVMERSRDARGAAGVPGVPTPENTSQLFARANALCRALFARYCELTGYVQTDNRFDPRASADWLRLTAEQRLERVQAEFAAACAAAGIAEGHAEVAELKDASRVVIRLSEAVAPSRRGSLLFRLERELSERVEPSLSVERDARKDINQIRRL